MLSAALESKALAEDTDLGPFSGVCHLQNQAEDLLDPKAAESLRRRTAEALNTSNSHEARTVFTRARNEFRRSRNAAAHVSMRLKRSVDENAELPNSQRPVARPMRPNQNNRLRQSRDN